MTIVTFLKTLVHPQLEYGNTIWGPFYTVDHFKVENVQRAATRLLPSITHLITMKKDFACWTQGRIQRGVKGGS